MRRVAILSLLLVLSCCLQPAAHAQSEPAKLSLVAPEQADMDSGQLQKMEPLIEAAITNGDMPGCVVAIGRSGKLVWRRAYGKRQVEPDEVAMTADTLFDLASLTKPIATATSVMKLIEWGKVRLNDRVADHIPQFANQQKERITIAQLLTHQSGLLADNSLEDYADGPQVAFQKICELPLESVPGEEFIYSDVGFIVLGELVKRVSGQDIHQFSQQNTFGPLGMQDTGYLPDEQRRERAAPTEQRHNQWLRGTVHDPRASALGGIAGHAGLFGTADDLAIYACMLLNHGTYENVRLLSPAVLRLMTADQRLPRHNLRGLGWDKQSDYSSNRSELFSASAFGHGGFTGTVLWIDPQLDLFVIFLSNRLHPDGQGQVNQLAGRIGTIAAAAIQQVE